MEEVSDVTRFPGKRQIHEELHKIKIAKMDVEHGREHQTPRGKIISGKKFEAQVICKCDKGCCSKIDVLRQKELFDNYYHSSNWTQKTLLIRSSKKKPISSCHNPIIPLKRQKHTLLYTLDDADGVFHKVCRDFYMKCINVTSSRIVRAVNTATTNPSANETRGHAATKSKTPEQDRQNVINFINLFPKYESHYSRKTSQKKYLHPNLNVTKLYDEYKNSCEIKNHNIVSQYVFREIFNNSFNLSFKRAHTDTCKTCDDFKCSLKAIALQKDIEKLKDAQNKHMQSVEEVCSEFKGDVENAIENDFGDTCPHNISRVI